MPGKVRWLPSYSRGTDAVELFVIESDQPFTPFVILPYPFAERVLDLLLLLLRDRGFLPVQDAYLFTVRVDLLIEDADIL